MNVIKLIRDLRRRRVFRASGYYLIGAWVVLQVADVVSEPAGLPPWTMQALLFVAVLGFPIAVYLGWRYQIGEHGIERTKPITAAEDEHMDLSLKASDYVIFAAVLLVSGFLVYQYVPTFSEQADGGRIDADLRVEAPPNSVAVLPFADISQGGDQQYLGDGISDTVMHVLSRIDGLIVTARTSSFAFKGQNKSILDIARALGVANILEGSVQTDGNAVRIIARLIEAQNGTELWSGNFDRELQGIFEIQDEIAREVAVALQGSVFAEPVEEPIERYRPNLEAYEKLILGRAEFDKGTSDARERAGILFGEAIELDPGYAEPYVDLAWLHLTSTAAAYTSMGKATELAEPLIEKALELDPLSAAAHTAKGFLLRDQNDPDASTRSFLRAIELNPNHAAAYAGYGSNLFRAGKFEESLVQHKKATELDPQDSQYQIFLANAYWTLAQSEKALAIIRDNIERDPTLPNSYSMMVRWLTQMGRLGEAMQYQLAEYRLDPASPRAWYGVCDMHRQLLDEEAAFACVEDYLDAFPDDTEARMHTASWRGDWEQAIELARQLVDASPQFPYRKQQLAVLLAYAGQWDETLEVIGKVNPDLLEPAPVMNSWNVWMATLAAQAFIETGESKKAQDIARAGIEFMSRQRKLQGGPQIVGVEDAQFHALLGEREEMLRSLEEAINRGWTFYAMDTMNGPSFEAYADDPEFRELVDALKERITEQRLWLEEHKDDPV